MGINALQIILLVLYAFIAINDSIHSDFGLNRPLIAGCFAGLVMGDLAFGLTVGATLQLMVLGVSNFGGSSIPDFMSASLVGTALGVSSGQGVEFGIGLAIPAGMLLVQIDVLARFCNTFLQHRADACIEMADTKRIELMNVLGVFMWGLSRAIPVALCLVFGSTLVDAFVGYFPTWLSNGLKVAGGLLPAVGISILLRYLPTRQYLCFLLIGFALAAYLGVPMLGVGIFGLAFALITYAQSAPKLTMAAGTVSGGADEDE
ncbi:PTS sugar transporter subunit IIC [uncultured Enorma sp.]|uniref:PTS mannose/fructose/sorbose/N-acetylgalactosamine transporter subunit IIC n=1 Tax=uncultured Enorma sp. TaxID=1714346 RepID=UPI002591A1FC|nr:PTS sugar transporter subunit IIC [uncultured Enorma sp.]